MANLLPGSVSQIITEAQAAQMSTEELRQAALNSVSAEEGAVEDLEAALSKLSLQEIKDAEFRAQQLQAEAEPEEFIATRKIDLGPEGGGIQVFTGRGPTQFDAQNDLADKLALAQRHATEQLRKLSRDLKGYKAQADAEQRRRDDDSEYVLQQKLRTAPGKTVKELVAEAVDAKDRERQASQEAAAEFERQGQQAQADFVATHEQFYACKENGEKMRDWVQQHFPTEGFTVTTLEQAWESLKDTLLPQPSTARPSAPNNVRRSSSIRPGGTPPPGKTELTESELYALPMDQLRRISDEAMARAEQEKNGEPVSYGWEHR